MHVLVIDDDLALVRVVTDALRREGASVATVADGTSALDAARRLRPDLVLLDLELPGRDGLDVCRALRRDPSLSGVPVIMMTGRADEVDRIVGLEVGADDYVVKPFSPRELVLRVKAVLRRSRGPHADAGVERIGTVAIDRGRRRVVVGDREVALTVKEFDLLGAFMAARGRVLSRDALLRLVWGYEHGYEGQTRTVDVHVRQLRQKLGPEAHRLETVTGVGYRFLVQD